MIELLVVIAIISLLVSILLPSLQQAKQLAIQTVCLSNLKQIGTAAAIYSNDYREYALPAQPEYNASMGADDWVNGWAGETLYTHGYIDTLTLLFCPAETDVTFLNEDGSFYNNMYKSSYGVNRSSFGMHDQAGDLIPQTLSDISSFGNDSNLIHLADGTRFGFQQSMPTMVRLWSIYPTDGPGQWFSVHIRHMEKGNTLLFDGHAETMAEGELREVDHWLPCIQVGGKLSRNYHWW